MTYVVHVGDDPKEVAAVERPRLLGDVRRGIAQAQIRLQAALRVLGDHGAVPVRPEAVHHHPVEPGQGADLPGSNLAHVLDVAGLGDAVDHRSHVAEVLVAARAGRGLELDQDRSS